MKYLWTLANGIYLFGNPGALIIITLLVRIGVVSPSLGMLKPVARTVHLKPVAMLW